MAITRSTLRASRSLRVTVDQSVDQVTRDLVKAWVTAWDELANAWESAAVEIAALAAEGPVPGWKIAQLRRVQQALAATEAALAGLAPEVIQAVASGTADLIPPTVAGQAEIMATQFPRQAGTQADLAVALNRVDPASLAWIVQRTTEQVTSSAWSLASDAANVLRAGLARGIGAGDNPRQVARQVVKQVGDAFNGGLARAMTIARTEMLDAHRAAAQAVQEADADVLSGWVWQAKLDSRTCPSCWGMHGTTHPLDQPGPMDHQNGRCARLPKVKSWEELGFEGIDEPDDALPDARDTFYSLPRATQQGIMGTARLDALDNGMDFVDLSQRRTNPGWRDSYVPVPVRDLPATA